jgi:flagellar M-ring protein FliF
MAFYEHGEILAQPKLKEDYMNAIVENLREMNQIKIASLIGAAFVLIGFFTFLALKVSAPIMSPLYTNVSLNDGGRIIQELDAKGIPYKLRANGTQILVPGDDVNRIRLEMADLGLPSSGSIVGYEIFDENSMLGTSNFVLNVNQVRALEGELSRTISAMDIVDSVRVHLVVPKRELFARDNVSPTASVALRLRSASLGKRQVSAIQHLVATAVPGLIPDHVTIVDSRGNLLAKGGEGADSGAMSAEAEDFRTGYESRMRRMIERLLEQVVGTGNVKAEITADIDFDRIVSNRELYDPEGQVARSVQSVSENERENENQNQKNVSVGNNLPDASAGAGGGDSLQRDSNRTEETTNFEISKEIINSIKETGTVKRLSVAVLVNGTYAESAEGEPVYSARTEAELDKLTNLIESAIGFDKARGDEVRVINLRFIDKESIDFKDDALAWIKDDLSGVIQTLVLGGVAILAILLVIRPLVTRALENASIDNLQEAEEEQKLLESTPLNRLTDQSSGSFSDDDEEEDMINIEHIQGKVRSSSYNKINSLVEKHPEETVQIIRQWIMS